MEEDHSHQDVQPLIHRSTFSTATQALTGSFFSSCASEKSFNFILIPSEDKDGNHRELLQKVYVYPQGSISTVFEKSSHQNILKEKDNQVLKAVDSVRKENFCIKKKGSTFSSSSSISSGRQSVDSNKIVFNSKSPCFPVPSLSPNINFSQDFNYLNISNKYLDNENFSDNSSLLSNASDLSFYNEEYAAIKKMVSDIPVTHIERKAIHLYYENKASQTDIKFKEQDYLINSLQLSNEELDIQIQKLSSQLKKTIREKESSAEHFEIMQTKISETNKNEYFQILKDKVTLEGQYETLNHEHENCFIDKNLLQVKIFEMQTELFEKDKEIVCLKKIQDEFENYITELKNKNSDKANNFAVLQDEYQKNKNRLCKLERELEDKRNDLVQNEVKLSNADFEINALKQSNERLEELSRECKSKEDFYNDERKILECKISESNLQFVSMKDSQESLQIELNKVHNFKTDLQRQLTEARASITVISAERDRIKVEMERLNVLIGENKTSATREKTSLLMQLEELEADMKEREAAMSKCCEDDLHITVNKERFKMLEDVYKRFQILKVKMGELQRENESIVGEIKHKKMLQNKNEVDIRDLRKELVVTQEKVREKELSVSLLNSQLKDAKLKLEAALSIIVEKDNLLLGLKEDKMELDTLLNAANEDKRLVDTSISKLKEDMNKLTANHFRMKHDIVAKERQIELLQEENSNLSSLKLELSEKLQSCKDVHDLKEQNKILEEEVNSLKAEIKMVVNKEAVASDNNNSLKNTLQQFVSERKSIEYELKLCNEQIASLQLTNKTYADKLMDRNKEISLNKDHILEMEKDCQDLKKKISHLNKNIANFQQDEEDFSETRNQLQKFIEDLKANLKIEIFAKNSLESRHKKIHEEFLLQKMKYENKVENLEKALTSIKNKFHEYKQFCESNGNIFDTKEQSVHLPHFRAPEHFDISSLDAIGQNITNKNFSLEQNIIVKQTGLTTVNDENEVHQISKEIICPKPLYKSKTFNVLNIIDNNSQTLGHRPFRKLKFKFRNDSKFKYKNKFTYYNKILDNHANFFCNFHHNPILKSLENKANKIIMLSTRISELNEEINYLKSENENLSVLMEGKNESNNLLQKELDDYNTNMLLKSNECIDWKMKYEGLCDFIPQKDTNNIKKVVALHHSQFQVFNNKISANDDSVPQEMSENSAFYASSGKDCKITKSQSLNIIFNKEDYDSALHSFGNQNFEANDAFRSTISSTMTDQQIFKSHQDLHSFPANFSQGDLDWCTLHQSSKEKDYSNKFVKKINENIASVTSRNHSVLSQQEIVVKPMIAELERKLAAKEMEIMELCNETVEKNRQITESQCQLEQKELEFQNKRRQYVSNIRLLTRKLKEHMKGRRECEKDLKAMMQVNKQKLDCEEKKFNFLSERRENNLI